MAKRVRRLTVNDLGKPGAITLPKESIRCLADNWGNNGDSPKWIDIELVVRRFYEELANIARPNDEELLFRWNHLLMAVGNFKRQGPTSIWPAPNLDVVNEPPPRVPDQIDIPYDNLSFRRDDQPVEGETRQSWRNLQRISGVGVPTATTLLSALWPGHHFVFDIRDVRAGVGLNVGPTWRQRDEDSFALPSERDWEWYGWLRECLLQTAARDDLELFEVERALYILDQQVLRALNKTHGKSKWLWSQYEPEARRVAEKLCEGTTTKG
jgi:hypothetical protein